MKIIDYIITSYVKKWRLAKEIRNLQKRALILEEKIRKREAA